jgi:signal transduction histidine kinase
MSETHRVQPPQPIALRLEKRYGNPAKWGLLAVSILLLWIGGNLHLGLSGARGLLTAALVAYALTTLIFTLALAPPLRLLGVNLRPLAPNVRQALLLLSFGLDHLYAAALIALTGGFRSEFYLFLGILAIKSAVFYPYLRQMALISFSSGLLWIAASYLTGRSLFFLADRGFVLRYLLLFVWVVGCLLLGWLMELRQRSISTLGANLSRQSEALDDQTHAVQRTAGVLANRLLELRSLQESVKAINSSLDLDELLQLIAENATQVLRGARCAIALVDERRQVVVTSAAAGIKRLDLWGTSFRVGQGVAGWVVENRHAVLIDDVDQDPRFRRVGTWPVGSMICTPLISDSTVLGTLTATSPEAKHFTNVDLSLLDAFGDQAAIAVKNSSLYEKLVQEEKETARLYQSVLEKSNELEAILRGIGDAVIVTDPQLGLLMMNPVAARIFHVVAPPDEGTRLPEIIAHQELLLLTQDTLAEIDTPLIREITLASEGERPAIYQALASTIKGGNGLVRGVAIVMRDITTQKEIDQIKSDFLSVVSHELRTPLHSIKGFVEIILMGKTGEINDLQRDFLTTVKDSTTNLQRLIDDLLEFSRMEAGQVKLKPEMISTYDVAAQVIGRLAPLAENGRLQLLNRIPETIDLVEADPMRIEQVLTNLISNAIKFTPEGGSITVAARDEGEAIRVSVKDTGIGISEEEQANIFRRFYQVDGGATRAYRGAGLGLTICKFIVEYHHGQIGVNSQKDLGSTFFFTLPKELPQDDALVIDFTTPVKRS